MTEQPEGSGPASLESERPELEQEGAPAAGTALAGEATGATTAGDTAVGERAAAAESAGDAEAPAPVEDRGAARDGMQWFALQVYLGHENKVKNLLEKRYLELRDPAIHVGEVLVPTQEIVEIKGGKKVKVTRNLYPGYILVEMRPNEETLHFVNNVHGVIKFLGAGKLPQPLRPREINKILGKMEEIKEAPEIVEIPFDPGDSVEVTDGPFSDFNGTVEEVYPEKGKVKVTVSLFGRPTSVELDYLQLKKI
jgi:transcription termination/antitermination protein NusG